MGASGAVAVSGPASPSFDAPAAAVAGLVFVVVGVAAG
jgi:hypothetical protein